MARKLRLEFPGACYHVINRGNYRHDVFRTEKAKAAFEKCLFEACQKSEWRLHAYVIMRNHYHLALETPAGNLVSGMQWLQATFANRFNRFHGERGHLFQGRYKALLVEEGGPLAKVADYIHLNPVRAGICPVATLRAYRFSSYRLLFAPQSRPRWLDFRTVLHEAGRLSDALAGWRSYAAHLAIRAADGALAEGSISQGWAVGSEEFKVALMHDHALVARTRAWERIGANEIRRQAWQEALLRGLRCLGRRESELMEGRKSECWKVALAVFLRESTQASNGWLGETLRIGRANYVARLVSTAKRRPPIDALRRLREQCTT